MKEFVWASVGILIILAATSSPQQVKSTSQILPVKSFKPSPVDDFQNLQENSSRSDTAKTNQFMVENENEENKLLRKRSQNTSIDTAGTGHYGLVLVPDENSGLDHPPLHEIVDNPDILVKPLKPSVVHRDPHAHFDKHDQIRTQDHDRRHQLYPSIFTQEHPYPYSYDVQAIPECAHKNRYYYDLTFCLEDSDYPTDTILWAIRQSGGYTHRLLTDVTYQSADNLVDGLTKAEEEGYTYDHYFGGSYGKNEVLDKYKPPYNGYTYSPDYYKKGGYICPSNIFYARPLRAMNTYGKWKLIVNLDLIPQEFATNYALGHGHYKHKTYTQTLRIEQCIYSNAPCSYIDHNLSSRCVQKHNFQRLVAWTHEEGMHIDVFKLPVACSCHIRPSHPHPLIPPIHTDAPHPLVHHHHPA